MCIRDSYFQPRIARAALAVLQHAGWRVRIPRGHVCCGRPLYEFGMLDRARDYLAHAIGTIGEHIRNGTPIVCLEPACVSTFREDLLKLLPFDAHAKRLSRQVLLLDELLEREAPDLEWPRLRRDALVHQHCHQKTVLKSDAQSTLLERLGVDARIPDTGCCGMAGSFGFEAHKYDVSIACGERVLLPAVRRAPRERLIVADGFSCREQIEQTTGRRAMHTAQVLEAALRQ